MRWRAAAPFHQELTIASQIHLLPPPRLPVVDFNQLVCWLMHHEHREVLLPGLLPWQLDAVVFCWKCDRFRGRAVPAQPQVSAARA